MIEFTKLDKNVLKIKEYIKASPMNFCNYSLGVLFAWGESLGLEYAIYNQTLIMKTVTKEEPISFYYPIGKDVDGALTQIEEYTKALGIPLVYACVDLDRALYLSERYNDVKIGSDRDWSDYIYDAEPMKTFSGKKYGGQRNHYNKFKKLYPEYKFFKAEENDIDKLKGFLYEHQKTFVKTSWVAKEEERTTGDLIDNIFSLGLLAGYIEVDGKVVAISIGEIVGDTLIIHIEKGFKEYEGVYQAMVKEFANAYADKGVKYINREEDCGDMGLRISKMQYHPIEIKNKNFVEVKTLFNNITEPILVMTERLTLTKIEQEDKERYFNLYTNDTLNEYWGYDYREDLGDKKPTPDYFFEFSEKLKEKKQEYSLAVRLGGKMIGEVVMHNFDHFGGVELGCRILPEYQGLGYGVEAVKGLADYAEYVLKAKAITMKCFLQNEKSKKMIQKAGFTLKNKDEKYFYFVKK